VKAELKDVTEKSTATFEETSTVNDMQSKKVAGKYVKIVVRHGDEGEAQRGTPITVSTEQSFILMPDEEAIVPIGVVENLNNACQTFWDEKQKKPRTVHRFHVQILDGNVSQEEYSKHVAKIRAKK